MCALWLVVGVPSAGAGDGRRVWKTVETEHFVIHYYEPLLDVARRVAAVAEYAHTVLTPVLKHKPTEKTQIVITDDTDGANGFANTIPRNRIRLYSSAPSADSTLNDHDDWLFNLASHEYVHVLHLDSIGGLAKFYNKIFGKTWSPNHVQPRWVIEGIATYEESKRTSSGRTRNSMFDMQLRAVTLAEKRLELDAVSHGPRTYPRGTAAYLYGSHFLKYIFDRYGDDKLAEMSWAYGSNPIPYSLNRTIKRVTGKTFVELYDDWRDHLRDKYSMQVEAAERAGLRVGRRLTFSTEGNYNPRYSKDGTSIIWQQSDGYSKRRFRSMPVGKNVGRASDYFVIHSAGRYDLFRDGSMLFEQSNSYRTNYSFQDLFRWDRKSGTLERFTHGMRAREPTLSPDERHIAFIINGESKTRLGIMPLRRDAEYRILWEGPQRFDQAATPHFSPDGRKIAFSSWTRGGFRDIRIVDIASGQVERITHDRAVDIEPKFSPDGAYLYYVSDRSGIYNVYAYDLESKKIAQVTNVLGGTFWPDISPDGKRLVYSGFGVEGYDIYEIDLDKERWFEPVPYVNSRPDPVGVPDESAIAISAPRPYRPIETMAPQSYTLQLGQSSFGTVLNVQTGGNDIVGWHNYAIAAALDLGRKDVNMGLSYSYSRLWPSFRLGAIRNISLRSGVILDGENTFYTHETYGLTASLGLPVLRTADGSGQLSLDYDVDWLLNASDEFAGHDPNTTVPEYPNVDYVDAGMALRFSYSDAHSYAHTVGPLDGQSLSASLRFDDPALGSDTRSMTLSYRWNTYLKLPWGVTPALAFRVAGGLRTSDKERTSLFVLGGMPVQDIPQAIINGSRVGTSGYLRGYPLRSIFGAQYHLANIEYRQQIYEFERGLSSLPVFVNRLHFAGLFDVGNAFSGDFDPRDLKIGVGAAVRLEFVLAYFLSGALEIGYARGLMTDGVGEYWTLLTSNI